MRQRLLTFVSFSATLGMASAQVVPRNIGIPGPGTPMPPLPSPTFCSSVNPREPIISISGRQFSAEIIRETAHLTHDGTQITQRAPELMLARDSAGRVHVDGGRYYDFSLHDFRTTSYIYDPSARALYVPDATTKTACEISWSPSLNDSLVSLQHSAFLAPDPRPPSLFLELPAIMLVDGKAIEPKPERTIRSLGTKQIEGVTADGLQATIVVPAGWQGYDQSFRVIVETWLSKDLGLVVSWALSDPRVGESVWRLAHIDRSPPDTTLFHVPEGYSVIKMSRSR